MSRMRKKSRYSATGGLVGRRERALKRLEAIKEPNKRQLAEIKILKSKLKRYEKVGI